MLEFMNTPSCNHYYLVHRIKDCEKNLTAFNYATPMAICIEAMHKNILHLYDKSLDIQDIERRQKTLPCWSLRRHPVIPPPADRGIKSEKRRQSINNRQPSWAD